MAWLIIITAVLIVLLFILLWKYRCLRQDVYSFYSSLEDCLDRLSSGKRIEENLNPEDSLWNKTYEKLRAIDRIWEKHSLELETERQQIKELISDISHQTKTPVANLKIYLELLQSRENTDEQRTFLKKMEGQTEKLDFLLKSLVKMSRLEAGVIEIRQQEGYIYDTIAEAAGAAVLSAEKKQIRIYVDCEETIVVRHDRKWTGEVIFNLLENAVKYTQPGGEIRLKVSLQECYAKIIVEDSGKGILPEHHSLIFKRFYREPEVHEEEGIGVGLYLARKIVTMQGGYIEVHSDGMCGSRFCVYLPV